MIGEMIARTIIKIEAKFRGERLSPKGEMLAEYCKGVLRGESRYIEEYEKVVQSTMEYNGVDREEACQILSVVLDSVPR